MRVILVPVADRPECARALGTAFDLGQRLGASVSGCHLRPHRYSEVSMSTAFADAEWREKSNDKAPAAARTLFEKSADAHGYAVAKRPRSKPCATWAEKVGSPGILMGIVGPMSDLVVVSRPKKSGSVADMFMTAALFESLTPVLIVPQQNEGDIGRHIVIGWNQSDEVARTVKSSLAMLAAADSVTIVICGREDHPGPKSTQLAAYLKQWGIGSKRVSTRGRKIEQELMGAYRDAGGDLLLTGAYSRNRWRKKVFGGTTEYLLHKAGAPLLMQHG